VTDDIVAFLRERLDEDERAARKAASLCGCHPPAPVWIFDDDESAGRILAAGRILIEDDPHPDVAHRLRKRWNGSYNDLFAATHIARHDPARVLREVEARRRTLEWHLRVPDPRAGYDLPDQCGPCYDEWPCYDVRNLASVWSDHPDYREEWRP
jgi:hypothetical protein